jgi:WD40 repeat protein
VTWVTVALVTPAIESGMRCLVNRMPGLDIDTLKMRSLPKLIISASFCWCIVTGGLLVAQSSPELVIQRADSGSCEHAAFSHDGQLLATDNGDEVFLWEIDTGRLLNTMKSYLSPEIKHMKTGATLRARARAKGTVVFSPDDKVIGVLPVDFANPLNFGPAGAPSSLWNVDTGLPLTTEDWNLDDRVSRTSGAPSTPEVETWSILGNRSRIAALLDKGTMLHAISSDGTMGASRSEETRTDEHIQIIDLKSGQVLRTLGTLFSDVLGIALSPDGRYLAAHSSNRRFVTIWDTSTGAEVTEIKQDVEYPSVGHIAFSPDGKWFAAQQGRDIVFFETANWKRAGSFSRDFVSIVEGELTFSPNSKELAVAGGTVNVIEVPTGKLIQTVCTSPLRGITAVQWNSKTDDLGVAGDKFARIWAPAAAATPTTLIVEGTIHALALSNDGHIAIGTRDAEYGVKGGPYYRGATQLWQANSPEKAIDLGTGVPGLSSLSGASSISLTFRPDGGTVVAAMFDELACPPRNHDPACDRDSTPFVGLLTIWNTASGSLFRKRTQPDPELNVVAFSPDGSQIASGHQNRIVKIYDAATLNRIRAFRSPDARADPQVEDYGTTALGYSPDGKFLLAGARDGLTWVVDTAQENPARILRQADGSDLNQFNENRAGQVVATLFSRDGKYAYAVESTGMVWKWNTSDWSNAGHFEIPAGVSAAALSPNSRTIAVAINDGTVRFYAADSGQLKLVLASAPEASSGLAITPDGRYDLGIPSDSSLAAYRVGRKMVTADKLPGNRRVSGLLLEFLKENAEMPDEMLRIHGQD